MVGATNPGTWHVYEDSSGSALGRTGLSYNQLLEVNPLNAPEIIGDLAESWELGDDKRSFIFKLRKGVKWTDGEDFTADDVIFSFALATEEGATRPFTSSLKNYVKRVEKIDQHTVRIHQTNPSLSFLAFLAQDFVKMLPKHHLESGEVNLAVFGNSVGTGPFMDVDFQSAVSHTVERNPGYFKEGRPHFDGIKTFIIGDKGTEIAAFKSERVLMSQSAVGKLSLDDVVKLEEDAAFMSRFGIHYLPGSGGDHLIVNAEVEPFSDPRVRRALFLALHRQPLVEGFGLGKFTIGKPMSPENPYSLSDEEVLQYPGYRELNGKKHPDDIAEAKRLLAEAGFPDGKGFKAVLVAPISGNYPDVAQVIKEQLTNTLGVEIDVRALEIQAFLSTIRGPDFQMSNAGHSPDTYDPDFRFQRLYTDHQRNWSRGFDPEVVELWKKQQVETDFEKRREIAYEMQRKVIAGAPSTMEYLWKVRFTIVHKRIKSETGDYLINQATAVLKHEHEWLAPE